ncbi:MAG: hypothetical protein ABIV26_07140 [Candidatus Limnocylindrales bacterium]
MTRSPAGLAQASWPALALAVALALLVGACGGNLGSVPASNLASPAPPSAVPASPVDGVITHVESAGLDKVTSFTIRTAAGALLTFRIGPLDNGTQFPPGHLTEHQATSEAIRVTFRVEGSDLVAIRLDDAGG